MRYCLYRDKNFLGMTCPAYECAPASLFCLAGRVVVSVKCNFRIRPATAARASQTLDNAVNAGGRGDAAFSGEFAKIGCDGMSAGALDSKKAFSPVVNRVDRLGTLVVRCHSQIRTPFRRLVFCFRAVSSFRRRIARTRSWTFCVSA